LRHLSIRDRAARSAYNVTLSEQNVKTTVVSTSNNKQDRGILSFGAYESQIRESLSGLTGTVKSYVEDWMAYTPSPPYIYGNVEFEDGAPNRNVASVSILGLHFA